MPKPKFDPSQPFSADKPKFDPNSAFTPVEDTKTNPFQAANAQEDRQGKLQVSEGVRKQKQELDEATSPEGINRLAAQFILPGVAGKVAQGVGAGMGLAGKALGSVAGVIMPGASKYIKLAQLLGKAVGGVAPEAEQVAAKVASPVETIAPKASNLASSLEEAASKPKFDPFTKKPLADAAPLVKTPPKIDPFSKIVQKRSDIPQD